MGTVVSIDRYLALSGEAAHAAGRAFELTRFDYHDEAVGTLPTEGKQAAVVVVTDPATLSGIYLTKEDALELARAITFCAGQLE